MAAERLTDNPRALDANANALPGATWTFYASGTTTPLSVYADADLTTPLSNPVVADAGGKFAEIYFDGSQSYRGVLKNSAGATIKDADPINAASSGFNQNVSGSVQRDSVARERERLSVLDFIPTNLHAAILDGTSTTNVQAYIDAAIAAAMTLEYGERTIDFPAGLYNVGKIDLTGVTRVAFRALGTVQIVGVDATQGFVMGSSVYSDGNPETGLPWVGDPPFNRGIRFTGAAWLVGPKAGQLYDCGWLIEGFVDCIFEQVLVSGEYGNPATGDRTTSRFEMSFLNTFDHCNFGNPRAAAAGFKAYSLKGGSNNINGNAFRTCRFVGPGAGSAGSIGASVSSATNSFDNCDVAAVETAFVLDNAGSTRISNCYTELTRCAVDATAGNSKGTQVLGGTFEIVAGGTALKLGSSENFIVSGGRWTAAGAGCTFINFGAACYHPSITAQSLINFDTLTTGAPQYDFSEIPAVPIIVPGGFKIPTVSTIADVTTGGGATAAANATAINAILAALRDQGLAA